MSVIVTTELARKITDIIGKYHTGVSAILFGEEVVTEEEWAEAVNMGLVDPMAPRPTIARQLHTFGAYLGHVDQVQWQDRYGDTAEEMISEIERNPMPMTVVEQKAHQFASHSAAQHIVGLGNKVGAKLGSSLIEADTRLDQKLRSTISDVVAAKFGDNDARRRMKQRGIDKGLDDDFFDDSFRSTVKKMASDMGHATDDWARDFDRIAQTENQRALNSGLSASWQAQEDRAAKDEELPPERIVVYKIPRPDACRNCIRLHLDGETPRLFYLDELEGNGVNVGRKVADWKAVVGPVHPFCACSLVRLPKFIVLPKGWRSGQSASGVVGPGGGLVLE